jgi:hypothetical protein
MENQTSYPLQMYLQPPHMEEMESGELTRAKYIQTLGYKYQARTDL